MLSVPLLILAGNDWSWQRLDRAKFGIEMRDLFADFAAINFQLFSKESLIVASIAMPFYAGAYLSDEAVHDNLYDNLCHTNTFTIGCFRSCFVEDVGIMIPFLTLIGYFWSSPDYRTRLVGRDLLGGIAAVGIARGIIKECFAYSWCYRPYSGCFARKRVLGGFPSGHAATLTYATMLIALQKGAKWAIPVGAYAASVMTSLLICNYHYLSQIIAGAALGAIYAVAANTVIEQRYTERLAVEFSMNQHGAPLLSVSYSF